MFNLFHRSKGIWGAAVVAALALWCAGATSWAIDIIGVREAALDQPRVNLLIQPAEGGNPYDFENFFGGRSFNIVAFLDTGSSGSLIFTFAADTLSLPREPGVFFYDIGVGGATEFEVTPPLNVRIAPTNAPGIDNLATYQTVYDQAFGPMRLQVGPTHVTPDPFLPSLNVQGVLGMPVMQGKTVVMDPSPLHDLSGLINTYLYDPGTPFNPAAASTNPGIPSTSHHVKLSYGDFKRFTETTPAGAEPPLFADNPFIGPNPLLKIDPSLPSDDTPPVEIGFGGRQASGSFLLDTGAFASFISTELAASLGVRYSASSPGGVPQLESFDPDNPGLPGTPIADQFVAPVLGVGGAVDIAGFFLDDLLLHTLEAGIHPDNNIRYVGAPVLVHDITVVDPLTQDSLTLDGIFGMNFLVASISLDFGDAREGPYQWITFDQSNGLLGLDLGFVIPEPSTFVLAAGGILLLLGYAWRRRGRGVRAG